MNRVLCECTQCGHRWFGIGASKQCPNKKCRSTNWRGEIQDGYGFSAIEVGESKLVPWKTERHKNYLINQALIMYERRSKRKFRRIPRGFGLEVIRLS